MAERIGRLTKRDFDEIISELPEFWGDERTMVFHHPIFLHEFGNTAYVIKEEGKVAAYLFGFISQTAPVAYVHLIGIRNAHKRKGLGRELYAHFIAYAGSQGCKELKAITTPTNGGSIAFHKSLGMKLNGEAMENGIAVVKDYSGPGQHRVVFSRPLP
jgi:RimJ/RimL family protein N-acetyltransferase